MAVNGNKCIVLLVVALTWSVAAGELDLSQINVNDLQSQLPPQLANTNFTLDDFKSMAKEKCVTNLGKDVGEAAYQEIETATMGLVDCATNIINITALQAEIEEAKPTGELDVVFNSYCKKRPAALECIEGYSNKLKKCLDKEEQENQEVFMRVVRSMLNFICYKGGDQIALFIAEKGPECLESQRDNIQQCMNDTFSGYLPEDGLENVKSIPKLVLGQRQCDDVEKLEKCIVGKLEKCEEITPANIVESLFRFVKNETICGKSATPAKQTGAAANSAATEALMPSGFAAVAMGMGMLIAMALKQRI